MAEEEKNIVIRNYSNVWNLQTEIYSIEGLKLPFKVNLIQAVSVLISFITCIVLARIFPGLSNIFFGRPILWYVGVPAAVTWFLTKKTLDGKAPHKWIISQIRYYIEPKRLSRFAPIKIGRKKFSRTVIYRLRR